MADREKAKAFIGSNNSKLSITLVLLLYIGIIATDLGYKKNCSPFNGSQLLANFFNFTTRGLFFVYKLLCTREK
jgi:hypothetical protein